MKDHTFFYVDYEGQRETGAQGGLSCVPDPAADRRDRCRCASGGSESGLSRRSWRAILGLLPTSQAPRRRQANPWDRAAHSTPAAQMAIIFLPLRSSAISVDSLIGKVDQNFASGLLTGRYYFGDSTQSFPFAQLAGGLLPGFNTVTPTRVQLVSVSYVKNVNSSQVNEARLGWNRFAEGFFPQDSNFNPNSIGLDTGVTSPYDFGLPKVSVTGFSPIGATTSVPRSRVDSNWHFIDNYSWKSGRHEIKFGYEFRRSTIELVQDNTFRGKLGFDQSAYIPRGRSQQWQDRGG